MSPEVSLLNEVWEITRRHVNKKDRLEVADAILQTFEDHVDISEIELYKNEFDSSMKAAIVSLYDCLEDDEDDEWE
jgi:hypothetical protein